MAALSRRRGTREAARGVVAASIQAAAAPNPARAHVPRRRRRTVEEGAMGAGVEPRSLRPATQDPRCADPLRGAGARTRGSPWPLLLPHAVGCRLARSAASRAPGSVCVFFADFFFVCLFFALCIIVCGSAQALACAQQQISACSRACIPGTVSRRGGLSPGKCR